MTPIHFTIKGQPLPWQRAGRNGERTFNTARNENAKSAIAWEAKVAMGNQKPIEGPVRMRLAFLFDWPKSYTQKRRRACYGNMVDSLKFGDLDNHVKQVCDALNSVCYADDSQVAELHASKFFTETGACTRVTIEPLWSQESESLKIVEVMK